MEELNKYLDAKRGRRKELADALGISPSAVTMWPRVPAERVLLVEQLTGVSRHDLRPDIYGLSSKSPVGSSAGEAGAPLPPADPSGAPASLSQGGAMEAAQ